MFKKTQVCRAALLALAGVGAVTALPVQAQQTLERVEITGTSLRRIEAETALPVTVIRVEELTKQGINTAEQALSMVAANQANFGVTQAIGATTGGKAEADIRGLSGPLGVNANKTLVLLNGRRLANHPFDSAAVDLNAIPLAAVDRIEILRDGASAIYGTDAIGGVINFILRRDYKGVTVAAEHLAPQASGGGDISHGSVSGGFGSLAQDRFNILATLDVRKQRVLEAKDRSFAKTGVLGPTKDDLTAGTSGTSFPGDLNGFEPSAPNCNPPGSLPRFSNPDNTGAFSSCRYDFTRDIDIIPENEQVTGLIRGSLAVAPEHTASVEYLYANNRATSRVAPAPTSHLMPATSQYFPPGAPLTDGGIPDINGGPNVPGGVVNWRQVPGGKRTSGDDTTNERGLLELQGTLRGWDYRTAVGKARSKSTASVKRGYLNDDMMQQGVWDGVINPFGDQTPAGQAAIDAAQVRADTMIGKSDIDFADVRATGDLVALPAGSLSMAIGAEFRREASSFVATDITAALPSLGIDPDSDTSGSRKVKAVFVEFGVPVVKTLDLTFAARYDNYSDFGSTTNPKVSFRWQPAKQFLLRGSYNKGFRAPTLYEIYQPRSLTYTSDNYDDPLLCPGGTAVSGASEGVVCGQQVLQRNSGPVGIGLPAETLQPEKSDTVTLGAVFQPVSAVTVGVDLWRTKIKNQILGLPEQAIFGDPTKYAGRFVRCSALTPAERSAIDVCLNYPSFDPIAYIDTPNENLGDIKVSGVDLSAAWRIGATSIGHFGLLLDGTYITKFDYQREKDGAFINAVGRYSDNAPVFRWQHVLTLTWDRGPWGATVSHRFKSGYKDQDEVHDVGSYEVIDASLSFVGVKNLTLTAGIRNLLDSDPPRSYQVTTFQRGYDPRFTDPLGRTFVFQASYKFF
jgi:iron complex outermembrane receptor protein